MINKRRKPAYPEKNIYSYRSLDSTNLTARRLAEEGAPSYSIVIADEQKAGRGRQGRSWFSPPGLGLWFSIILRSEDLSPYEIAPITLVTAAVLASYFRKAHKIDTMVKWPNDLLVKGAKIGGILTESRMIKEGSGYLVVVGIGLNINQGQDDFPPQLKDLSTSLFRITGKIYNRKDLFLSIRKELFKAYRLFFVEGFTPFQELWEKQSSTLGRTVKITWPGGTLKGEALGLKHDGALLIKDSENIIHQLHHGEIES